MPLFDRLRRLYAAVRSQGRLITRLLLAAVLSYAIASWLQLPQSYWATITALVVVQASVGATMGAGLDRIIGTLIGAAVGATVALGRYHGVPDLILLGLALTPLSILAALRPTYRIAPITAVIALLAGSDLQAPWIPALHRVAEISLGTAIGIGVSLVVWPSRARLLARAALARALAPQSELLHHYLVSCNSASQASINALNDRFRNELAQAEKALVETQHEPGGDADALQSQIRAVRRLHSDILFVGRLTQHWQRDTLPPELQQKLDALDIALQQILSAIARAFAAAGQAGSRSPAAPGTELALGGVDKALGQLERTIVSGARAALPEAALLPTIGQILRRDLSGLVDVVSKRPVRRA